MSRGSLYEQVLSLQACYGTRNTAQVLHIIKFSPSTMLRRRALDVLVTFGIQTEVLEALHSLQLSRAALHDHALKHLCRRKRLGVIDEFLSHLQQSRVKEEQRVFKKMLWTASPKLLSDLLPSVFEEIGATDLTRLLRRHAEVVWGVLLMRDEVRGSPDGNQQPSTSFLRILNPLLQHTYAKDHVPGALVWDLILDVIKALLRKSVAFSKLHTSELERRRPLEVVKLVIEKGIKDFVFDKGVLRRCTTEQLLVLQKLNPGTLTKDNFRLLKREQRSVVFREMDIIWRGSDGVLPLAVVNSLPFEDRLNEVRKYIQLPAFETEPQRRIPYAALLPWDEGMLLQEPFIRSNDADIRSRALNTQIKFVARQPAYLSSALKLVLNRRHEQDPVRHQCLLALAEVPVRAWREQHLDLVARITRHALDAPDLSRQSVFTLLNVTARILFYDSKWASAQLALIIGERQQAPPYIALSPDSLVEKIVTDLGDALLPVLEKFRAPGKGDLLVSTIAALQDYLNYMPTLVDRLEYILKNTDSFSLASQALNILFASQPERLPELTARLVRADPGWIIFPRIEEYMVKHRLVEYQVLPEFVGRFGMVRPTIRYTWPHSQPWKTTQLQQEKDLTRLLQITKNADRSASEWQRSIKLSATLLYVDFTPLITLVSDPRPVVAETTIRVLGRLDAGQGMPPLRSALLDPDRIRIAIYALRPALKCLTASEALEILSATPMTKATVAKEIIRIAHDLNTEASHTFLRSLSTKDNLHRDAFIALLSALSSDITRDDTFRLFKHAAQNPNHDPEIPLAILQALPSADGCLEEKTLERWKDLLVVLLQHPSPQVRSTALRRAAYWEIIDEQHVLASPLFKLLDSKVPSERRDAGFAIIRLYSATSPPTVGSIFSRFLELKDYSILAQLVAVYAQQDHSVLASIWPTTELVLDVLAQDRVTSQLRLEMLFRAVPTWMELRGLIERVAPWLTADALVKAEGLVEGLGQRTEGGFDLDVVERDLASAADAHVRRLGLSALLVRAGRVGWTEGLRERLAFYRGDIEVLVAEAAAFVFPP